MERTLPLFFRALRLLTAALAVGGCAAQRIPNTDVPDTRENREVVEVAEHYRRAVELRDTRALIALASPNYFEDGGTPSGDDDYGFDGLQRLLSVWADEVREVRYEMRYRRVTFDAYHPVSGGPTVERAMVEYTYTGSFTLRRPPLQNQDALNNGASEPVLNVDPTRGATPVNGDQEVWYRRVADNRLELERRDGQWRILAGM